MVHAVIFDIGGVLVRTEDRSGRVRLEKHLGLAPGEAEALFFNSEMGRRAQEGSVSTSDLYGWIQSSLGLSDDDLARFKQEFWAGDVLDEHLVAYIRSLRPAYQTAIISNARDDLLESITTEYPMADAFDLVVGSAYEGIMKPAPEIYERALARLRRQPEECVFIDDFVQNVEGARRVGLRAIQYVPGMNVPEALAQVGVRPITGRTREK